MPANTAQKRYSASCLAAPFRGLRALPTGAITQGERQAVLHLYSGILAGGFVPPPVVTQTEMRVGRSMVRGGVYLDR